MFMKNLVRIVVTCLLFWACNGRSTDSGTSDSIENSNKADSTAPADTIYPKTDTGAINK
jgi:hypothetical protein